MYFCGTKYDDFFFTMTYCTFSVYNNIGDNRDLEPGKGKRMNLDPCEWYLTLKQSGSTTNSNSHEAQRTE